MGQKIVDFQRDPYLRLIRPLAQAYLGFYRVGSRHIEGLGLTGPQFDVLAELGGTEGMTCAELGEATLITKGTLTGVLDRMEGKGLLERLSVEGDRRAIHLRLTSKGEEMFNQVFPAHAEFMRPFIQQEFTTQEVETLRTQLFRLRDSFQHKRPRSTKKKEKLKHGKGC
jgi:MarR family 2-MHQ and catechol resistance regulon transcriptional repressor